jgi:hypothetical protein
MDGYAALIIVGLIGIAIGFAVGVAVGSLREPRQGRRAVDTAEFERRMRAPAPPAVAAPAPIPPQASLPVTPLADLSTPPLQRPSLNTVEVLARALQPDLRTPEPPSRSIAAQVDEILQEMLKDSPFASRLIRLIELPSKGVVVMVGQDQYDGVESVPDEDIRQIIRLAVAEWERRVAE